MISSVEILELLKLFKNMEILSSKGEGDDESQGEDEDGDTIVQKS